MRWPESCYSAVGSHAVRQMEPGCDYLGLHAFFLGTNRGDQTLAANQHLDKGCVQPGSTGEPLPRTSRGRVGEGRAGSPHEGLPAGGPPGITILYFRSN